jgi:hypothetical protein
MEQQPKKINNFTEHDMRQIDSLHATGNLGKDNYEIGDLNTSEKNWNIQGEQPRTFNEEGVDELMSDIEGQREEFEKIEEMLRVAQDSYREKEIALKIAKKKVINAEKSKQRLGQRFTDGYRSESDVKERIYQRAQRSLIQAKAARDAANRIHQELEKNYGAYYRKLKPHFDESKVDSSDRLQAEKKSEE